VSQAEGTRTGRLAGKVAIVTGAGTGLGHETARLYAREGASVVVSDIRETEGAETVGFIREAGGEAIFTQADVAKSDDVRDLVASAEERYGAVHIMTANAGILGRGATKHLVDLSEEELDDVLQVNLLGVLRSFKFAIPAIQRAGGGAMTATSSIAAHRGIPTLPAYSASKGGVEALVRSLAMDLWPDIRVNAVTAGSMSTPIYEHFLEEQGIAPSTEPTLRATAAISDPAVVAHTHLFLVSDEAAFTTGQAVIADGGRSVEEPA
jgi:NAD(P)-dependent dehydrogenase (short-subunit alcohol dehydrogenase family)